MNFLHVDRTLATGSTSSTAAGLQQVDTFHDHYGVHPSEVFPTVFIQTVGEVEKAFPAMHLQRSKRVLSDYSSCKLKNRQPIIPTQKPEAGGGGNVEEGRRWYVNL